MHMRTVALLLIALALASVPARAGSDTPGILLVDDDWDYAYTHPGSLGGRPYYTSALDALGLAYEIWDVQTQGQPSGASMAGRDAVLWFTGYAFEEFGNDPGVFVPHNEARVATYLDTGGSFLLSSPEYYYDVDSITPFMQDYLGVEAISDVWVYTTTIGTAGNPIGDGIGPMTLVRPDDYGEYWPPPPFEGPYDDEVYPLPGAGTPFQYDLAPFPSASTNYENGTFRTVFLGWPLEWLDTVNQRAQVLGSVLAWMGCSWAVPGAPLLLAIGNADGDGSYLVDWSDTTGATGYVLEEDDDPAFGSSAIRYQGPDSELAITAQAPGLWYYRARAVSPFGDGPWSNVQSAGVLPAAPVLAPISNPDGNGSYLVEWSEVPAAASYALEEDDDSAFASPVVRYSGPASELQVGGQLSGTWYYRVRAANAAGGGPWSNSQAVGVSLTLHLFRLRSAWSAGTTPGTYKVSCGASLHDQDHLPAPGVTVSGKWKLPDGSILQKTAVSSGSGLATFRLASGPAGSYKFCVTGIQKSGYTYNAGANEVSVCKSFVVGP